MKRLLILFISLQFVVSVFAQQIQLKGTVQSVEGEKLVGVNVSLEGTNLSTVTDPDGKFRINVKPGDKLSFTYIGFKRETATVREEQEILDITLKEGSLIPLIEITGSVTDEATGRPLLGAQIKVADTPYSAFADEKGHFSIEIPSLYEVLVFAAPDYALRELPLQGRQQVDVQLYRQAFTSGYANEETLLNGAQRKARAITATSQSNDFSGSTAIAFGQEMQARLGGDVRTLTRSGMPGMGTVQFIRGLNSLNANAQPLIVVDGVIWDAQLSNQSVHNGFFSDPLVNIEVKDIESITVLKDGNTIYGSRAANGVILVTTTRGKDMTTRITANASWGTNLKPRLPELMNAAQYMRYASDQAKSYLETMNIPQSALLNRLPFLQDSPHKDYTNDTDWLDLIYQDGFIQNYSLNVSGGDEIALYNLSVGYSSAEGTVINTGMERFHSRFNSDIKLYDNVSTKVDISIARTARDIRDQGDFIFAPEINALLKAPILAPYSYLSNGELSPTLAKYDNIDQNKSLSNPLSLIENAEGTASRVGFRLKVYPSWQVNEKLKIESLFAYGMDRVKESYFVPEEGVAPWRINNGILGQNAVQDYTQRQISISSDTRVRWDFNIDSRHYFSLLGGFRYMSDTYESDLLRGYNTGNDNVKVMTGKLTESSITGVNETWKSLSWYADLSYHLQKKYFLSLTAAADASSRFGKKTKSGISFAGQTWGVFPSVGAAWLISSEEFMQNLPSVNLLKLRAGYGLTGNDDINSNAGRSFFAPVSITEHAFGLLLGNIQNESIQWETSAKAGLGLDAHLFNERLTLSADVFHSETDHLLTLKELPSVSGLQYYWSNGGRLQNTGGEASFNAKLIHSRNFGWELGASIGHYKNEITALPDGDYNTEIAGATVRTAVGHPAGVFYGYRTSGVFATTEEALAANLYRRLPNTSLVPYQGGDVHFVNNFDGDNIIDEKDMTIIGDPNPDCYGTISSRFKYKRFTLDAFFTYSYGNDVYNMQRRVLESGSGLYNQNVALTKRWTTEGQRTSQPRALYGDPMENNIFSDRWIEDGSYLRLKTLALSYEIPFNLPYLQGITLWASANNLYTWTKYLGSDPEFSMNNTVLSQGIDAMLTPLNRSYHVGIKINL
jgi:TonB-linked SusC/RagA family outer membrane protein